MYKIQRLLPLGNHVRQASTLLWLKPDGVDTGINVYNCVARRQVPLILSNKDYVTWYTCGPTVYASSHLGHASCYVKLDIIQRILRQHFNLNLVTAMNITDIDDKLIFKSQESGRDWREIAKFYEQEFWSDLRKLNVAEPNLKIRVTEHIPKIVSFIESIIQKGLAYVGKDNSVYFKIKDFPNYGKLQKLNVEEAENEAVEAEIKAASADFALWKTKKNVGEPSWSSPWGNGRPGWHIECSSLASYIFGNNIDFHAGGLDLKFPHHENEEAQSCVHHNTNQWVNYWLHAGHLRIKGQKVKMSKSLKNTISIEQMLAKYTADDFRMACLLSNYRNPVEYSDELMETSRNTLNKFKSFREDCEAYLSGKKLGAHLENSMILQNLHFAKQQVEACFKDDFDTARSIGVLMDQTSSISRCINANVSSGDQILTGSCLDTVAAVDNFVGHILRTFGITFVEPNYTQTFGTERDIVLNGLLNDILQSRKVIRERAVAGRNSDLFQICDELRNCLRQNGIEIRDHSQGSSWSFSRNR